MSEGSNCARCTRQGVHAHNDEHYECAVELKSVSSEIVKSVATTVMRGSLMVFIISISLARACSLTKWCLRVYFSVEFLIPAHGCVCVCGHQL